MALVDTIREIRRNCQDDPTVLTQENFLSLCDELLAALGKVDDFERRFDLHAKVRLEEAVEARLILVETEFDRLQAENAALSGRCLAAEQNLAASDDTGRALQKKLIETIKAAFPS